MRKQAEIRQETEMKKEAVKKRDAKMEMEKRTESRKAEVEARKAERAERRRIALAQKEAPNLVQAQKSQAVTQPPDLGYDHELFGEVSESFGHAAALTPGYIYSSPRECLKPMLTILSFALG